MSVWIPYLRSSPTGGRPGWGYGLRPRSRADGCRLAASKSVCGSPERAADGLGGAPGAVNRARDVAGALCGREERRGLTSGSRSLGGAPGSQSITDACSLARGHPGIELRRGRPLDPARCDSAPKPSWCATGEISPASVSLSAAGWPTRRTACSFSLAVSLGDDGPFARALLVPLLWAVLSWLLLPPEARPSRGISRRQFPPTSAGALARGCRSPRPAWPRCGCRGESGHPSRPLSRPRSTMARW